MVLNDVAKDIRKFMVDLDWRQTDLADAVGLSDKTISRLLRKKSDRFVNQEFLDICEALGYDIRFVYVPKEVK